MSLSILDSITCRKSELESMKEQFDNNQWAKPKRKKRVVLGFCTTSHFFSDASWVMNLIAWISFMS